MVHGSETQLQVGGYPISLNKITLNNAQLLHAFCLKAKRTRTVNLIYSNVHQVVKIKKKQFHYAMVEI